MSHVFSTLKQPENAPSMVDKETMTATVYLVLAAEDAGGAAREGDGTCLSPRVNSFARGGRARTLLDNGRAVSP